MSTELFVSGFLLSLTVCLDLGTVNIAMLRAGLQRGAASAFWLGVGSCVGDLVYAGLSAVAISVVLQFAAVRWALWLGGSGFMLFLAIKMIRESWHQMAAPTANMAAGVLSQSVALGPADMAKHVLRGLGLALSSPSAILWFATVGGSVIATQLTTQSNAERGPALLTFFTGFFVAGIVWTVLIALVSGQGRKLMGPQLTRGLTLASALMFAYFAVKIFVDGYGAFVLTR